MVDPSAIRTIHSGTRVLIAAVVPSMGEEDRPLLQAVTRHVEAAGGVVVAHLVQRRGVSRARRPGGARQMRERTPLHPATWLGKGKVEELAALVESVRAELVLVPHPLTGTQCRNLEDALGVPVHALDSLTAREP